LNTGRTKRRKGLSHQLIESDVTDFSGGNLQPATSSVCHAAVEARAAGDEGYAGMDWLLSETA
jgi:hypothetical protein